MQPTCTAAVAAACLTLVLAGCAAKPPPAPQPAPIATAPSPPAEAMRIDGFSGAIEPLVTPVALAYRPAEFRGVTRIGVRTADGPASSLGIHVAGGLRPEAAGRLRATLTTERIDVDGQPGDNAVALLVQEIGLGSHGELVGMTSRTPASTGQRPERHQALEQGWRDRLPLLASGPVAAGDALEAEDRRLTGLRLMLGGRDFRLEPVAPVRTTVVGTTSCGGGTCLIGRRGGSARLAGARGEIDVNVTGYALLDLATGLLVTEREQIVLAGTEPDGTPRRLVMSVESDLELR